MTNFDRGLLPPQSDLARQTLKDPYQFNFLSLAADVREGDLERALVERVRDVLLELGKGFAFIGSQYHLEVGGQDFYVDLLFYRRRLHCLVAADVKTGAFRPEHAGKMNFYLAALDEAERYRDDNPSIGLILCRERNRIVAEYALRTVAAPIGVAEYRTGCRTRCRPGWPRRSPRPARSRSASAGQLAARRTIAAVLMGQGSPVRGGTRRFARDAWLELHAGARRQSSRTGRR